MAALQIEDDYVPPQQQEQQNASPTWGDYGQAVKSGAYGVVQSGLGLKRYFQDLFGANQEDIDVTKAQQQTAEHGAENATADMSEVAQKRLGADITSEDFWHHFGSTMGLKAAQASPMLAAAALPGGLTSKAILSAASMGAQGSGSWYDDFTRKLDAVPDEELQKQSKLYGELRTHFDEGEARRQFGITIAGLKPAVVGLANAAAGYIGPAGTIARGGVAGAGERGLIGRMAVGGAENAAGMALQEGVSDSATQAALIDANQQKEFDPEELANKVLTGGVTGFVQGAPFGILNTHQASRPGEQPAPSETVTPESNPGNTPTGRTPPAQSTPPAEGSSVGYDLNPPSPGGGAGSGEGAAGESISTRGTERLKEGIASTTEAPPTPTGGGSFGKKGKGYGADIQPAPDGARMPEDEARKQLGIGNPQDETTSRVPSSRAKDQKSKGASNLTPDDIEDIKSSMDTRRAEGAATPEDLEALHADQLNNAHDWEEDSTLHHGRRVLNSDEEYRHGTPEGYTEPVRQTPEEAEAVSKKQSAYERQYPPLASEGGVPFSEQVNARAEHVEKNEAKQQKQAAYYERTGKTRKGKAVDEATQQRNAAMREVIETHEPSHAETPEQTVARARGMVEAAGGIEGLDLSKRLRGKNPAPGHFILKEANDLVNATGKKWWGKDQKKTNEALQRFRDRDQGARKDYYAQVLGERRSEGEIAKRQHQGDVEELPAQIGSRARTFGAEEVHEHSAEEGNEREQAFHEEANQFHAPAKPTVGSETKSNSPARIREHVEEREVSHGGKIIKEKVAKAVEKGKRRNLSEADLGPGNTLESHAPRKAVQVKVPWEDRVNHIISMNGKGRVPTSIATKLIRKAMKGYGEGVVSEQLGRLKNYETRRVEKAQNAKAIEQFEKAEKARENREAERKGSTAYGRGIMAEQELERFGKLEKHAAPHVEEAAEETRPLSKEERRDLEATEFLLKNGEKISASDQMRYDALKKREKLEREKLEREKLEREKLERESNQEVTPAESKGTVTPEKEKETPAPTKREMPAALKAFHEKRAADRASAGGAEDHIKALEAAKDKKAFGEAMQKVRIAKREDVLKVAEKYAAMPVKTRTTKAEALKEIEKAFKKKEVKATPEVTPKSNGDYREKMNAIVRDAMAKKAASSDRGRAGKSNPSTSELPEHSTVREVLGTHVDLGHLSGIPKAIQELLLKKFRQHSGDMPIHFVGEDQFPTRTARSNETQQGLYHLNPKTGKRELYINKDLDKRERSIVVMHELAHDATSDYLDANPRVRKNIQDLMDDIHPQLSDEELAHLDYAFKDEHEFVAEAIANPEVHQILQRVGISGNLARAFGLKLTEKTGWHAFVDTVYRAVKRLFGHDVPQGHKAIEAILKVREHAEGFNSIGRDVETRPFFPRSLGSARAAFMGDREGIRDWVEHPTQRIIDAARSTSKLGNALTPNYQFAENVKHLVKLAPKIMEMMERMSAFSQKHRQDMHELVTRMIRAEHKNPEAFGDWARLVNAQTMRRVRADYELGEGPNSHIQNFHDEGHEEAIRTWTERAAHPELKRQFDEIAQRLPEVRQLNNDVFEATRDEQNILAGEKIAKILQDSDVAAEDRPRLTHELTRRVSGDRWNELKEQLGEPVVEQLKNAKKLQTDKTPYAPLRREGDWVVHGTYKYNRPDERLLTRSEPTRHLYEFASREEAHNFAMRNADHVSDVNIRRYDPETGESITAEQASHDYDVPIPERYEVQLDPRHVEFHERRSDAEARQKELHESGLLTRQPYLEERQDYTRKQSDITSAEIDRAIKNLSKNASYNHATPEQRRDLENTIRTELLRKSAGHRIHNASMPRRNVKGASTDIVRSMTQYADSMANTIAKTRFMPVIESMLARAKKTHEETRYDRRTNELDPNDTARSIALKELDKRVHAEDPNDYKDPWTRFGRKLNTVNYLDRMARPFHLFLHQTHLPMITLPHIAGRHGVAAFKEAGKVMGKLGFSVHAKGLEDVKGSFVDALHQNANYGHVIRERLKSDPEYAGINKMLSELEATNTIHPQSGFEVERYRPSNSNTVGGWIGRNVFGRVDSIFRAATDATEAVNRYVGAITAYKLEYAKQLKAGKDAEEAHELATKYARDTVIRTEGLYSGSNAAPLFKNRGLRPFLQFRQFPLMMYHLLIHNAKQWLAGASKEEKMAGLASLMGVIGTHTLMTGLLGGLPLEIPKVMAWASKSMGITNSDWTDFERWQYEQMVKLGGKEFADYTMHGLGRHIFGADVHHRMGINSILGTFGMPEDKYTTEKQLKWLASFVTGAPGGLASDIHAGSNKVMEGNVVEGALQMLPFQFFRDQYLAWGKGGTDKYHYTPMERVVRSIGATPTGQAERAERQSQIYGLKEQYNDQRSKLIKEYTGAKDGTARGNALKSVLKFNQQYPRDAQITMSALQNALRNKAPENGEDLKHHLGVALGKSTKFLAERDKQLYSQ